MTNILPEPTENPEAPVFVNAKVSKLHSPRTKPTLYILVGLIIIAALCLVAGYTYDFFNTHNQNNTRKQDISYISGVLNGYHDLYHYYPTLNQLNSSTFGALAPSLDRTKFKDPSESTSLLSSSPASGQYAYETSPLNCNNTTVDCTSYKLIAVLSNDKYYTVTSPVTKG
ncbi:MAG TPA: hypothetical protein VGF75_02065 [Candidatus Saccharimonadales bacterium]